MTATGLGQSDRANIEVLVETNVDDPGITSTLEEIHELKRPVTKAVAESVRILANSVAVTERHESAEAALWLPISLRPGKAYRCYRSPPVGFVSAWEQTTIDDLARMDIGPGLDQEAFDEMVRGKLMEIPIARQLLDSVEDVTMTSSEAARCFENNVTNDVAIEDLWRAFVSWMIWFYGDMVVEQEVSQIGIRRAKRLEEA